MLVSTCKVLLHPVSFRISNKASCDRLRYRILIRLGEAVTPIGDPRWDIVTRHSPLDEEWEGESGRGDGVFVLHSNLLCLLFAWRVIIRSVVLFVVTVEVSISHVVTLIDIHGLHQLYNLPWTSNNSVIIYIDAM